MKAGVKRGGPHPCRHDNRVGSSALPQLLGEGQGGGLRSALLLAGRRNFFQHIFHIMLNALVREANDSISELFKMPRSILVLLNLSQVNWAVEFHDQATGRAAEIGDELSQRMLPSEFETVQLMIA